jgi:light-regulated signal transduction histidine kinase (bacteriophytochrome)
MGDASQLMQVFQNLVWNALKFRGEKPLEIRIYADKKDEDRQFSVQDNGIGLAHEPGKGAVFHVTIPLKLPEHDHILTERNVEQ